MGKWIKFILFLFIFPWVLLFCLSLYLLTIQCLGIACEEEIKKVKKNTTKRKVIYSYLYPWSEWYDN